MIAALVRFARRIGVVPVVITLAACRDDAARHLAGPASKPPVPPGLVALFGREVNGDPGTEGAEPLVVALHDSAGLPMAGVRVTWSAAGGGSLREESAFTDRTGLARAMWTLGDRSSPQAATATAPIGQVAFHGWIRRAPTIPPDTLIPVPLNTFDGSGQVVHPDVIFLPRSWQGGTARLAMAITPYPYGDARMENPSLFVSDAGANWTPPAEGQNPVAWPTGGYLSDPALVFDRSAHQVRLYYREVVRGENVIRVVATSDGVQWSEPVETIRVPSHGLLSPTVVQRSARDWLMWSVDGGALGCASPDTRVELRRSANGVRWSEPTRVTLDQPGGYPWHINVKWIRHRHEYWALYNLKPAGEGTCATPALYLATSPDGEHWTTFRRPVLERGASDAFADIVYRSSFVYTKSDDMVTFYFSGARWEGSRYVWSGAVERRSRSALFADLERPGGPPAVAARRDLPAPERFVGRSRPAR